MEYSGRKYQEKSKHFEDVRRGARALNRVVKERGALRSWDPATLEGTEKEVEKQSHFGRDVDGVVNYFENTLVGALETVCNDNFEITYHIYGDVGRQAMFGENTNAVNIPVNWQRCNVSVELYTGVSSSLTVNEKIVAINNQGLANRDDVAKATGWNRQMVQQMSDQHIADLRQLLKTVSAGQNKMTRLVKGFLLMLECEERGFIDVSRSLGNSILYSPTDVIQSHQNSGRSYVYCSNPRSEQYCTVLATMGEAYPPSFIQSHVTVPADGESVFLVGDGAMPPAVVSVRLSAKLVYASILKYAMDLGVTDELQGAFITACSLQQNRYFARVGLPLVVAYNDLMVPIMTRGVEAINKPIASGVLCKSLGRIHQMLCFMTARDVITAGMLTTKLGFDGVQSIQAYLSLQEGLVERMGSYFTDIKLMEATSQFKFLSRMDDLDFADLAGISAFEGLWLCDRTTKIVDNGVVAALKRGMIDMSDETSTKDILINEIQLAGVRPEMNKVPNGEFIVEASCVGAMTHLPERKVRRIRREMVLVHDCNFKPGAGTLKSKARFGGTKQKVSPVPPVRSFKPARVVSEEYKAVPMRSMESEPVKSTPPPKYREISPPSSPISGESEAVSSGTDHALPTRLAYEASGSEFSASPEQVQRVVRKSDLDLFCEKHDISAYDRKLLDGIGLKAEDGLQTAARKYIDIKGSETLMPTNEQIRTKMVREACKREGLDVFNANFVLEVCSETKNIDGMEVDTKAQLWALKSVAEYCKRTESKGMVNKKFKVPEKPHPHVQPLVDAIDRGGVNTGSGSMLDKMRREGSKWEGDLEQAPAEGIRYVAASPTWKSYLERMGVDPMADAAGIRMHIFLANYISRGSTLAVSQLGQLATFVSGTTINAIPIGLTRMQLEAISNVGTLPYIKRETSMGARTVTEADSKYLLAAAKLEPGVFDFETLAKLKREFKVEYSYRNVLDEKYGLFKSNNPEPNRRNTGIWADWGASAQ